MKIGIIYSKSKSVTKKSCIILSDKLKAKVQLIPINKAKNNCILEYNMIIIASTPENRSVKQYINRNIKTLKEKPFGLIINCDKEECSDLLTKTFSEELLSNSLITSNFGYELDEKSFIDKRKINKEHENIPVLNLNEINYFADFINKIIDKRVD